MKRVAPFALAFVLVAVAVWTSYSVGYNRGFERALIIQNGTFVGSLDALEKLRAGDVAEGTGRLETLCFSAANSVYEGRTASQFIAKTFLPNIRSYRDAYRSNSVDWTVAEQNLEAKLAKWK